MTNYKNVSYCIVKTVTDDDNLREWWLLSISILAIYGILAGQSVEFYSQFVVVLIIIWIKDDIFPTREVLCKFIHLIWIVNYTGVNRKKRRNFNTTNIHINHISYKVIYAKWPSKGSALRGCSFFARSTLSEVG